MDLDLSGDEAAAPAQLLSDTIDGGRYPLWARIQTLKTILAKLAPKPVREPLPRALAASGRGNIRRR